MRSICARNPASTASSPRSKSAASSAACFIRRLPNRARAIEVIKLPELSGGGNGNSRRGFTPSVIEGTLGKIRNTGNSNSENDGEHPVSVPVMGRIAAGTPIEALQTRSNTISVVVALIDEEEATLKRFRRRGASIALEPANASYEVRILPPNRVKIQGKLIGLYRKY
jgi:repressor LexA